jgi:hypothetical protein
MRLFPIAVACLMLAGCHKDSEPMPQAEDLGAPQVATSIDDLDLPTDKSDQITSIDAATGDASGMPKDGGAVIQAPKPVAAEPEQAAAPTVPPPTPLLPAAVAPATPPAGPATVPNGQ